MKKLSILLVVLALTLMSVAVFADNPYDLHVTDDGVVVWGETGEQYNNTDLNRTNYTLDYNGSGQTAQLNVQALAFIPCYLKLTFNGNMGTTVLESFGPKLTGTTVAQANASIPSSAGWYHMVFDNEIGGFVDGNWTSLGHGRNAEVRPGPNTYIQACDIFKVQIFSNDNFNYDVISAPLTGAGGSLNLEMGTSTTIDGTYASFTFDGSVPVSPVLVNGAPCTPVTYFHRFRVPYSESTVHGAYSGTITFKAYTI